MSIDIEAPSALSHRFGKYLLPVLAEKPVDERFRRIGMGRALDNSQVAAAAADINLVARVGKRFHWEPGFNKGQKRVIRQTDHQSDLAFGEIFRQHTLIAANEHLLAHQFF